ncbi:hypothetical protein [Halopelagius longus]|uniref:DUF8130 domain-containing protein n=1 Tax=Halopelagius longus TaxID=1236180 RepID=A0A1H1G2G2_9EURY|nr:hypothetical protein [Halopelagius longus]RDI69887.1 hypothetical protein DWB78_17205 [Halopelagius longus]SDR07323.1 hypothetical protein SAMN05216278_3474 [Halopelagius longus]
MKRRAVLATGALSLVGLAGCLGDTEYRVTDATVESSPGPLALSVRITTPGAVIEHPADLELTLTNQGERPVQIRSYGVWPFGALSLTTSSTSDENRLDVHLYSPAYEESDSVEVGPGRASMRVDGEPLTRTLDAGASATTLYHLYGDDLSRPGTYYVVQTFDGNESEYSTGNEWTTFDPRVAVTIEEVSQLPL